MAIIFLEGHLFCSTCFLTKKDKYIKIFSMLHHEESPKKPQYSNPPFLDKAPPRFCLNPLFLAKIFRPASRFHQFWISWAPTRYEGAGGGRIWVGFTLCMVPIGTLSHYFFVSPISLPSILILSTIQPLKVLCLYRSY